MYIYLCPVSYIFQFNYPIFFNLTISPYSYPCRIRIHIVFMCVSILCFVLERGLGPKELLVSTIFQHLSIGHTGMQLPSSQVYPLFLLVTPLGRLVHRLGWYLQKALQSSSQQRSSTLGCQSTVDNDVSNSWNLCYLYYLNGPL